jgi:hypothetical protein
MRMRPDSSQWRDPNAYAFVKDASADMIAWEFLRRNRDYQRDYTASRTTKSRREFHKRWGLQFRRQT